jgi:serine protease Do
MPRASVRSRRLTTPAALVTYLSVCGLGAIALLPAVSGCGREAEAASPADGPLAAAIATASAAPVLTAPAKYDPTQSLAPMIEAVGPAVVSIYTDTLVSRRGAHRQGAGSGFVIDADGLVVTNHHVVDGASAIEVRFDDGQALTAQLLGSDPATDLALLKVEGRDLPRVTLGASAELAVGDWVVAVGNPMGLDHSATVGIISGKGRGSLGLYSDSYLDFLQTDADIAPGSSGGPLFDLRGQVVGINTAVGPGNGPGFAIPIDQARRVVEQLRDSGRVARGWLGAASTSGHEGTDGAVIGEVYADTPAQRAGLRPGDLVTHVAGERIRNFNELRGRIATTAPGTSLEVTVQRDGATETLSVDLVERPDAGSLRGLETTPTPSVAPTPPPPGSTPAPTPAPPASRERGDHPLDFLFTPFDPGEPGAAPTLGIGARPTADGLQVVRVGEGSAAEALGLRAGDVIVQIDDTEIRGAADVRTALQAARGKLRVAYLRDGTRHEATLEGS